MHKDLKILAIVIIIILGIGYTLYVYLPETGIEAEHLNKISKIITNKEYDELDNLKKIELSEEHKFEEEILFLYGKALRAKDKGDISNFQYFLFRIPKDYEGRLSEEIIKSREEAVQLGKIQREKEDKERKEKILAETKEANDKIIQNIQSVLNNFSFQYDEVQKFKWYHSWEGDSYPPRDAAHWYIIERNGQYKLRAFLVDFDDSVKWVFWDRVVFSTESENWTYFIRNCFAGQSGGGKSTEIVQGGKYETLDVPFSQVEYGYKLLAKGNNPIIRFQSEEAYHDYYLTSDDVNTLNTALYLSEQLRKIK